jgi:hypothetical protein
VDWTITHISQATTLVGIADALWTAVKDGTVFGPQVVSGWALLDGAPTDSVPDTRQAGDCDGQALLMYQAFLLAGGGSATRDYVHASTDSDVSAYETRIGALGTTEYLIFDFPNDAGDHAYNNFEGICSAAGNSYAITPKLKASSPYGIFQTLKTSTTPLGHPATLQYWARYNGVPDTPGVQRSDVLTNDPIPFP